MPAFGRYCSPCSAAISLLTSLSRFRQILLAVLGGDQLADLALRVVEVAEDARVRGAARDAVRLDALEDAFFAERALGHDVVDVVHGRRAVGAGPVAVAAADADVLVHEDEPGVRLFVHGACGAVGDARGVIAVVAQHRAESQRRRGEGAGGLVEHVSREALHMVPMSASGHFIGDLAADGAGLAADAVLRVDHHAVTWVLRHERPPYAFSTSTSTS